MPAGASAIYAPFVFGLGAPRTFPLAAPGTETFAAHMHHIIHHLNEENASLQQAITTVSMAVVNCSSFLVIDDMCTVFQLGYTTLFGSLVSYVFMRTGRPTTRHAKPESAHYAFRPFHRLPSGTLLLQLYGLPALWCN